MSTAPKALVKYRSADGVVKWREGRGFSIGEITAVGLGVKQARLLGLYVDKRRKSTWPQNIETLKKWLSDIVEGKVAPPLPTRTVVTKPKRGRAFRGLTAAGRKARGLVSTSYRETHNYKYKKKKKERRLKKRHEATRGLGNVLRISRIVKRDST